MRHATGADAESFSAVMMPVSRANGARGTGGNERNLGAGGMIGVLIVIGAIVLAAMFFVLYVRAIAAEKRADMLSAEVATLRAELENRS